MSIDAISTSERCTLQGQGVPRLLIVPGLNESPPEHWQSWLQARHRGALRVVQHDWRSTDLERWAARIGSSLARAGRGPWIAVAHSFGVLALARFLTEQPVAPVVAALLVAPADPDQFGIAEALPTRRLPLASTMVLSRTDPWLSLAAGQRWATRWGSHVVDLGDAGHINPAAGYRSLPFAGRWVTAVEQRLTCEARVEVAEAV